MSLSQEFLQSDEWFRFQETTGKKVVRLSRDGFLANGILHDLPLVGKYLYIPRGPIISSLQSPVSSLKKDIESLIALAKQKGASWIRVEPETEAVLGILQQEFEKQIVKAPHDTQPREIFVVDITPDSETLLALMKSKTRYNIGLAEKHGVQVFATREEKYKQAFLNLISGTARRKEIMPHPRAYYERFFTVFPAERCQLFVAEYAGQVVAANLLMIFGTRATYLHGGSGSAHRDVMAPYLLQWEQIRYAKKRGCTEYDFGGVKIENSQPSTNSGEQETKNKSDWRGITRFKIGFSPQTKPIVFPGAYDIILNHAKYALYNRLRMLKESFFLMKRFLKL